MRRFSMQITFKVECLLKSHVVIFWFMFRALKVFCMVKSAQDSVVGIEFPSVLHVMQPTLKVIYCISGDWIFSMQIGFKVRCISKFCYFQVFSMIFLSVIGTCWCWSVRYGIVQVTWYLLLIHAIIIFRKSYATVPLYLIHKTCTGIQKNPVIIIQQICQ